jgi:hypothetical protein
MGDNSMKASEYGIKNLKYVLAHLPEWTKEENDLNKNLTNMYLQVVTAVETLCSTRCWKHSQHYETIKFPGPARRYLCSGSKRNTKGKRWLF